MIIGPHTVNEFKDILEINNMSDKTIIVPTSDIIKYLESPGDPIELMAAQRLRAYKDLLDKVKGILRDTTKCSQNEVKWATILEALTEIQALEKEQK